MFHAPEEFSCGATSEMHWSFVDSDDFLKYMNFSCTHGCGCVCFFKGRHPKRACILLKCMKQSRVWANYTQPSKCLKLEHLKKKHFPRSDLEHSVLLKQLL
jgi:hypothetical protein